MSEKELVEKMKTKADELVAEKKAEILAKKRAAEKLAAENAILAAKMQEENDRIYEFVKQKTFDLDFIGQSPHNVDDDEALQAALRDFGRAVLPLRTPGPDVRWPEAGRALEATGLERAAPLASVAPSFRDVLGAGPVYFGNAAG